MVFEEEWYSRTVQRNIKKYVDFVTRHNASALLLSYDDDVNEVVKYIQGWLIPGGTDLDSSFYFHERHPMNQAFQSSL